MVQRKKPTQDFIVVNIRLPAIGGGNGFIKGAVGVIESCGAQIVEIGQCALLQLGGGVVVHRQGIVIVERGIWMRIILRLRFRFYFFATARNTWAISFAS